MTTQRNRTLTLELVVTAPDTISGRVLDRTGHATDFIGWLGLAGAIESFAGDPIRKRG